MLRNRHLASAVLVAAALGACSGGTKNENRIKPVTADLALTPYANSPDPAIFLQKVSTIGDLVTVDVMLHSSTTLTFDSLSLEFHFDPTLVQIADVFDVNPAVLGDCGGAGICPAICANNGGLSDTTGDLVLGVNRTPGCSSASLSGDTRLMTIGFVASTVIPAPGTRIELIQSPSTHGDCEILQYGPPGSDLIEVPVACVDGNATMTSSR